VSAPVAAPKVTRAKILCNVHRITLDASIRRYGLALYRAERREKLRDEQWRKWGLIK
jgi:hypothetical protein